MNLVIDQGNTAFKLAFFKDKILVNKMTFRLGKIDELVSFANSQLNESDFIIHASVGEDLIPIANFNSKQVLKMGNYLKFPFKNLYQSPETLGHDRIANASALSELSKNKNSLVIDLGTCIKYDFVNAENEYIGGSISPGLKMRFKSLNQFTAKLPLIEPEEPSNFFGDNTKNSILTGVMHGIVHEINGFINRYNEDYSDLTIFMTGGDANYFVKAIKKPIFANPDLTLIGLNEILHINIEQI